MILCLVRRPLDCGGVSGAIQIGNLQFTIYNLNLCFTYISLLSVPLIVLSHQPSLIFTVHSDPPSIPFTIASDPPSVPLIFHCGPPSIPFTVHRYPLSISLTIHNDQAPCDFGVSRILPLSSPAFRKRRPMKASRKLPAEAIPSVVKV